MGLLSVPARERNSHSFHSWPTVGTILLLIFAIGHRDLHANENTEFFEARVRPLLVEHCQRCHGAKKQEAGLRLDSRSALLKGGDSGPAAVAADPEKSLIISAVRHLNGLEMPPGKKLENTDIEILERWVKAGLAWPEEPAVVGQNLQELQARHWAFQPVQNVSLPDVKDPHWERTPVDRFVLAKLEQAGLAPSAPADRRTLIRRVTMDLTGLPPTSEEVASFVKDDAPDAYVRLVDRLLESPRYGEQWARHWLDVARYSDTKGYVYGREERFWVHAPAYRDWVIQSFNKDLRYDQFLLLQIAADQAAPQDQGAQAAMGFLTLGRRFLGLSHDIIDDRIDVVTRGTMGLTVACARCHDHKYDPIPTGDYYSLYGVFMNSAERLVRSGEPTTQDDAYLTFQKELDQRQQKLKDTIQLKRNEAAERVRQRITEYLVAQTELSKYPQEGFDQILAVTDLIPTFVRRWEARLGRSASSGNNADPVFAPWTALASLPATDFAAQSAATLEQVSKSTSINPRVLSALSPAPTSMRELAERYGKLFLDVDREWKESCERAKVAGMPEPGCLDAAEAEQLRQLLYAPDSPCLVPDESIVSTELYYDSGTVNELWKLQNEVDRWLIQSPIAPAHAVTLVDRAVIRPSVIFRRGNPANRGAEVTRHFLSLFEGSEPKPFATGSGRLELAQSIINPANPLTVRVWVNRVWQHHFGKGLVKTASDFGIRAETPSHPELLDWLATRFVADGWSTKSLHRLIVLSNTYQQRSDTDPESNSTEQELAAKAQQLDPDNRLLWRMNVRRLAFEEFRDSLLSIAGRLDLTAGGRAADLFLENGTVNRRRSIYGLVDRQFLPATMRTFDFANPDLHIPARIETTVPQQSLFAMNHPLMAQQARSLVARVQSTTADENTIIQQLYRLVYQRDPTPQQQELARAFLESDVVAPESQPSPESLAWQYGYGEIDETSLKLKSFTRLPYFSSSAWQGGPQFPDAALGWVQVTAEGGHPGNDAKHCGIRRWVAPHDGTYAVLSTAIHEVSAGNGIRCTIQSSRDGVLVSQVLHNRRQEMNLDAVTLKQGDTLDFVVDINADLNSDQHLWAPIIRDTTSPAAASSMTPPIWDAVRDFSGPKPSLLNRWEQLAQVLLISNELMFVD